MTNLLPPAINSNQISSSTTTSSWAQEEKELLCNLYL